MHRIKIHKKFLFTEGELINYLKTVKKFSKIDEEILATVTYKKAYEKLHKTSTLISFPYRQSREKELNNRPLILAKNIGGFIRKHIEESSHIDSILVNPRNNKLAIVRPLQIKFLGKGKYQNVTNEKFIRFLKKYSKYEENKISLIIVLESPIKIQLRNIVDWLKDNIFPFKEVVSIHPNNKTGNMEFYQLKPSKGTFSSLVISRKEMLRGYSINPPQ